MITNNKARAATKGRVISRGMLTKMWLCGVQLYYNRLHQAKSRMSLCLSVQSLVW